jgi:hypothetical protein
MARYQYQGVPATPPAPVLATGVGSITAAKAGTKYFWLQYRNRAGYSGVSASASIAVAANQKISATIPASARPADVNGINGTDIQEYVLLMNTVDDPTTAITVATFPGYQANGNPYSLPALIELTEDDHLEISTPALTVAEIGDLPANPVHGMRRSVAGTFYAYDAVFDSAWELTYPEIFSTYVSSALSIYGASRDISDIADYAIVLKPEYQADGSLSDAVGFWLVNDDSVAIPAGSRVGFSIFLNDLNVTSSFVGQLEVTFQGYANATTGVLDTTDLTVGAAVPYQGDATNLILEKDLPAGSAFLLWVQADFEPFELNGRVPQGGELKISPYFYTDFAVWNPAAAMFGSHVHAEHKRRRVVPNGPGNVAKALKGSATILMPDGGGFSFFGLGEASVSGIADNTAGQKVIMSINGSCYVLGTVPTTAVQRAIISTEDGTGDANAWAGSVSLDNTKQLQVTVTYPTAIRADYPDGKIAGSSDGVFNVTSVVIYVRSTGGGDILQFEGLVTPGNSSDVFTVGGIAGTNIGTSLPSAPSADFGLYAPADGSHSSGATTAASSFSTDTYEVAIAFKYENTVTKIDHDPANGNVVEASGTFATIFDRIEYYGEAVADLTALRAVSAAERSALQLRSIKSPTPWFYQFQVDSMGVDDATSTSTYAKPDDIDVANPGRWVRTMRVSIGTVTIGGPDDAAVTTSFPGDGTTALDFVIPSGEGPEGPPGPKGQKGDQGMDGAQGPTGSVSAASGLVLDNSSAPSTSGTQIAVYSDTGTLKMREVSDGNTFSVAVLDRQQQFAGNQSSTPRTITYGATSNIDLSLGNYFELTLAGNTTLSFSNLQHGSTYILILKQDGTGSRLVTDWSSTVDWGAAGAPTLTTDPNKADVVTLVAVSGSKLLAAFTGGYTP